MDEGRLFVFSLLDKPWQVLHKGRWMTPKGAWARSRVLLLKQWDRYPRSTESISCFVWIVTKNWKSDSNEKSCAAICWTIMKCCCISWLTFVVVKRHTTIKLYSHEISRLHHSMEWNILVTLVYSTPDYGVTYTYTTRTPTTGPTSQCSIR